MDNKELAIKRLVIFYSLAIIPLIGISVGLSAVFGEPAFASENPEAIKWVSFLCTSAMFAPSVACIITRFITKEGWNNTYLGIPSKKGTIKYYAFAFLCKPLESTLFLIAARFIFFGDMSFSEVINTVQPVRTISGVLMQFAVSIVFFFPAFGEEWGWRGYMMPKLLHMMPKPAAIVFGGVLWGLWHAPLTVIGHNFGVDYPGFPFVGIALMCAFCIVVNAALTFITERTRSVYAAAFFHMINNNLSPFIMSSMVFSEKANNVISDKTASLTAFALYLGISLITGTACFVLFVKKNDHKEKI